jgi:hypothetical protein
MNLAKSIIAYYESDDFKENYAFLLIEDVSYVYQNVKRLLTDNKWEIEERLGISLPYCTPEQCQKVTDYILDNSEDFTTTFNGYWVGHFCLNSVEFGEQEEQLEFTNYKTGKPYTKGYLRRIFDKEGFHVSGDYAYYVVSGGLMLDISKFDGETLLQIINS